jgi:hypothetical protein
MPTAETDEEIAPLVQKVGAIRPRAVSLRLSHSCVGAQLTSHLGKLKVPELCLRIRCVLRHRRKRSQKLSGINCVAAIIQLAGREPATFDCSVDRRFGDACGPCCTAWCVHSATNLLR